MTLQTVEAIEAIRNAGEARAEKLARLDGLLAALTFLTANRTALDATPGQVIVSTKGFAAAPERTALETFLRSAAEGNWLVLLAEAETLLQAEIATLRAELGL